MPATEAGAGEVAVDVNVGGTEFAAGNQVARGGIGIRPGEAAAAHLLEAGDAAVGAHHHDGDVGDAAIRLPRDPERLDAAIGVEPGAGIGRGAHRRALDLAGGEGLHHAGVVGRREQARGHAEGLLQQRAVGLVAAEAVGLVLAAEQADADLRHLLRPVAPARCRHLRRGLGGRREGHAGGAGDQKASGEHGVLLASGRRATPQATARPAVLGCGVDRTASCACSSNSSSETP
jgi:hypothetical protein